MSASSSQDRERRINLSINRLITQTVPSDDAVSDEEVQGRHDWYAEEIKAAFKEKPTPAIASDVNHASDLIKRKLIQTNPSQALRFTNLYSRLLALPVLNQKWAMLYLLYQLADSHDPNVDDRDAYEEYIKEERKLREQRRRPVSRAGAPSSPESPRPRSHRGIAQEAVDNELYPTAAGLKTVPPPSRTRSIRAESVGEYSEYPETMAESKEFKRPYTADKEPLQPTKRGVAIKSKMLAENYADIDPSEPALLRDLPYTLQGLSSSTLPFGKPYSLKLPRTLPTPLISLLNTLAEPSLLYRTLEDFIQTPATGLLNQSLRAAINSELRAYLTLVATLEGQIRLALSTIDENAPRSGIGKAGVTLKRCVVWTHEATMGLRLMSLIAEESRSKKGGQLISLIHSFSSTHGDPIVGAFAERLLTPVTRPFYDILRHWIYDGELSDPYLEFFVQEQTGEDVPKGKSGSTNVWEDKYKVMAPMIPTIITPDFAEKIYLIGKSLNFIRHSCSDSEWVESYSKESSKELRYGDTATLEAWIDEAYKTTMRRLLYLMTAKFHLFEHLQALKSYILLGQGDFIALLMESLAANLDRPAGAQYRHTLTAQLEHAIRGSNAQYDSPEVLRRLDARMLQLSHGDIGWDCFTLEYKIDAPVDVVVSDWGNRQYLKVFNFLWRIKRVEFALSSTWRKVTTGSRGVLQTRHATVQQTWKTTRGVLAEMVHFVGQLQYYILFEVIESSWTELQTKLNTPDITLDDMIRAHTNYLNSITHKGLLGARRRRFAGTSANEEDENSYMVQLAELLRSMLSYRDCVDGLYSWSVSDFTQRQEFDLLSTQKNQPSPSQPDDEEIPGGPQSEFPALQERLKHIGDRFRTKLQILLGDLAYQADVDLRFLGVAMNFNDVYQPVRRKAKSTPAHSTAGTVVEKSVKG
ncbi:Spc97/Spc98 family protein [Pseudomassariella vexata]|uniref:Spc97/Spc98 family protein n=1 Tax=Pseudomassariella vexata TaxID=1141098 RepID=A0A1Y2DDA7_9PEZI|nr:Spc97/Spc98 family protein [Pseudomassariella vexata]ORY57250.1 Spc97/Spc98 family protein [Pseudomassariella vexata]